MYRNYDQAALDAQYDLRKAFPHATEYIETWDRESLRVRESLPCRLDVAYGGAPGETLDIFPAAPAAAANSAAPGGAPVHVFIHGGYWRALDKQGFSFVAEPLVAAGSAVVVVNYALAPSVTVGQIVGQVREAIAWSYRNAGSFGGDPERLYVSGHSAGGHLTAMAMTHDWSAGAELPADLIKGGCAISGVFDLEPVRLCYLNDEVRLDERAVRDNSPLHRVGPGGGPLVVAVGGGETDEFLRQSAEFATAWSDAGNPGSHLVLPGLDHFSIMAELAGAGGALTRTLLAQMGL